MRIVTKVTELDQKALEMLIADEKMSKSAKIKQLFNAGYDVKEISEALHIRYNHAYNVIQNYVIVDGIEIDKASRVTNQKRAGIEAMILDGYKNIDIAKATKSTYNYIWKVKDDMKRAGQLDDVTSETPEVEEKAEPVKNNKLSKKVAKV